MGHCSGGLRWHLGTDATDGEPQRTRRQPTTHFHYPHHHHHQPLRTHPHPHSPPTEWQPHPSNTTLLSPQTTPGPLARHPRPHAPLPAEPRRRHRHELVVQQCLCKCCCVLSLALPHVNLVDTSCGLPRAPRHHPRNPSIKMKY